MFSVPIFQPCIIFMYHLYAFYYQLSHIVDWPSLLAVRDEALLPFMRCAVSAFITNVDYVMRSEVVMALSPGVMVACGLLDASILV
jgi:hypothetical protein